MKKLLIGLMIVPAFIACKKSSKMEPSPNTLEVEATNMAVVGKRTATWCGPCGSSGFPRWEAKKAQFGTSKVAYMAFKDAFSEENNVGDPLFNEVGPLFNLGNSVPTFFNNFANISDDSLIENHIANDYVIAGANYDLTVSGETMTINTTTKFFNSAEGEYVLAPYIVVENLIGYQNGHADGANTIHHNYVAGVAKPTTVTGSDNWGYQITSDGAKAGYTVDLEFEAPVNNTWKKKDISVVLVIFKKGAGGLEFVNAFTK